MKKKLLLIIPLIIFITIIRYTFANKLENDVRVDVNSDLIYYLSVKYDGVDVFGTESSDAKVSEVYSDIINVTDQIPDGLIFQGFEVSEDGTIGAIKRDNENIQCVGKVIDDTNEDGNIGMWNNDNTEYTYHGLHYNALNRTVSFKVKNLKAGCMVNVGIRTKTPATVDDPNTEVVEKRRDFYNHAIAYESVQTAISNIVHVFIGEDDSPRYQVEYQIEGEIPDGFVYPPTNYYLKDTLITVDNNIHADGYIFNGWTSDDVVISNNKFYMPDYNVIIKGSFTKINLFKVTYQINGVKPNKYIVPLEKEYYPGNDVIVDSFKNGEIFNDYIFNGWTSNDVDIVDNTFVMPNKNVVIEGSFSPKKYKVIYKFQGSILPDNSESLLPSIEEYNKGDVVHLANINNINGYKFLGWNKENNFIMPAEDVVIYGEWMRKNGEFEPVITLEIINDQEFYQIGDIIKYKATITNNENYPIKNVVVRQNNVNAIFKNIEDYSVVGNIATIDNIGANSNFNIFYDYKVTKDDSASIINEIELIGALADNYYELKDKEYKASVISYLNSSLKICVSIDGVDVGNSFNIKVSNNNLEYWVKLMKDECETLEIEPGIYNIFEVVPQEYYIKSVSGDISSNNSSLTINKGSNYQINFVNKFKNKSFMHAFGEIINSIKGGE